MKLLQLTDDEMGVAVMHAKIAKTLEATKIRQMLEREEQRRNHENELREIQKVCAEVGHVLEQVRGEALRKRCEVCGAVV